MTAWFNHILITVVLSGATVAVVSLKSFTSSKILVARVLMCANYDSNLDKFIRAMGWRKLKYQRLQSAAVMMYESLHGLVPEYLSSRFVFRNGITSYRLRNTENKLALPQPLTNYLKKNFSHSGARLN